MARRERSIFPSSVMATRRAERARETREARRFRE